MVQQNSEGRYLDKDILVRGNKLYSPDTCLFVPQEINNLLTVQNKRGKNSQLRNEQKPITNLVFGEGCRKKKRNSGNTGNFF